MYQKTQRQIKATHQQEAQHFEKPLRPPLAASTNTTTLTTIFNSTYQKHEQQQQQQQRHWKHAIQDQHHHQHYPHHRHHQQQHQKAKTRHYFSRGGLVFLIFLSVIKESLTTTYSTSYSSSLDVTTTVSPTNLLPYFDFDVPRNITVTVGQTGFLHCRVERLGDKDVSWIRKRDLHILTAGSTTYTSDQRFQVLRPENSGNWTLQIKYPQPRDSGIYECQINTEPKMSLSYTFNVVELKALIIGPTDLYVKSGSDINLTCKIMQGPHELGNIFWYKGSEIIDMTTNQNEIDSGTRITVENDWSDGLMSRLKIRRASSSDTGNYTCVPTIAKSSSVYVHVIIGEHPAAMQHNSSSMHCSNFYISLCCMLFTILTCCLQRLICTNSNINASTIAIANTNNTPKTTLRILATKRTATSTTPSSSSSASLTMVNRVAAIVAVNATSALAPVLALTAASTSSASVLASATIKDMNRIPAVVKQSKECILSSTSPPSSSSLSLPATTSTLASSAYFYEAATTAAVVNTPHSTCNGRISR